MSLVTQINPIAKLQILEQKVLTIVALSIYYNLPFSQRFVISKDGFKSYCDCSIPYIWYLIGLRDACKELNIVSEDVNNAIQSFMPLASVLDSVSDKLGGQHDYSRLSD